MTLFLLTLRLETPLRHAIDRVRGLRVAVRRPPTLILQLLTICLVAFHELAALRILRPCVLRREIAEPDHHHDAERCIGKLDVFRRWKWL